MIRGTAAAATRRFFLNGLVVGVDSGGFEGDVESTGLADDGQEAGGVETVGAEVVEDGPLVVEEGFEVDQVEGPDAILENPFAGVEEGGTVGVESSGVVEVGVVGGSEDSGGGFGRRGVSTEEDLAEFRPSVGSDDHGLTSGQAVETGREEADVTGEPVTDEVGVIVH